MTGMHLVESLALPPGQDYFSGSRSGPFVDTGIDVDEASPWGRIYLCEDTVGTLASLFGWIPPAVAEQMRIRVEEAEGLAAALQQRCTDLEAALDALKVLA